MTLKKAFWRLGYDAVYKFASDMIVTECAADQSIPSKFNRECSQSATACAYSPGLDCITCWKAGSPSSPSGNRCVVSRTL